MIIKVIREYNIDKKELNEMLEDYRDEHTQFDEKYFSTWVLSELENFEEDNSYYDTNINFSSVFKKYMDFQKELDELS